MVDPISLRLVQKHRSPLEDKYTWLPFEPNDEFTAHWWNRLPLREPWFIQALLDGDEVARIDLDPGVHVGHYAGTPDLWRVGLGIPFFEVSSAHRLRGIGTAVLHALTDAYPDRRFVAFSEGADGFWASLGWDRFTHATDSHYRPLYVQPTNR